MTRRLFSALAMQYRPTHRRLSTTHRSHTSHSGSARGSHSSDSFVPSGARGSARTMLSAALGQRGSQYKWGGSGPGGFDCSGLVQWAAARAGIRLPHQSQAQRRMCRPMSVAQAIRTPGALLFTNGHVAISLGDGRVIEASGRRTGVRIGSAHRNWAAAGTIPGMSL